MSAASNYLENALIDAIFRGQSLPSFSTLYVGLCTAAPSDSSLGTEVTGNNYSRVAVTSNLVNWLPTQGAESPMGVSSGTGGQTSNAAAVEFPTPSGSWGTVTHWIIVDAATGSSPEANLLFYGTLSVSKNVQSGDEVSFVAGALQVTVA